MTPLVIYLAHPISNADGVSLQRKENLKTFLKYNLPNVVILDPSDYGLRDEVDGKAIVIKNKMDILRSDLVVADMMKPSFGTSMECLFAFQNGKPLVILTKSDSAWIHELTKWIASDEREVLAHIRLNI